MTVPVTTVRASRLCERSGSSNEACAEAAARMNTAAAEAETRTHDARHLDGPLPCRRHTARAAQRQEAGGIGQDRTAEYLRAGLAEAGREDADDPQHRRD